jgi:hypothetical protein
MALPFSRYIALPNTSSESMIFMQEKTVEA